MRLLPLAALPVVFAVAVTVASAKSFSAPHVLERSVVQGSSSSSSVSSGQTARKGKEKGNQTKGSPNLRAIGTAPRSSSSVSSASLKMKAKEKANQVKSAALRKTRHDTVKNSVNNVR
jgi:hypothetical protein